MIQTTEVHTITKRSIRVTPEEIERTFAPDWGLKLWDVTGQPDGSYVFVFGREDHSKR